ncbi:unnamed protein product [Darwinula stevensoni]|uniref:Uncharacterized protein n=1 Tax=Darwinula stevensoni TaxID=69355 RepID=A0A7R8X4D8_9CRUS|nr:unnamed protein product [Darwinula stevensoni]CAG0879438.1 unnamed protein product [Darwinula stevensoni]
MKRMLGRSWEEEIIMRKQPGLSQPIKFYLYGLLGYFLEVMYTAIWEFVVSRNWAFHGCTSVWSLPIYGVAGLGIEHLYFNWLQNTPAPIRGCIYLLWSFMWEFSTGYILRHFHACPWDYSAFSWNINGLITLEYAPLWFGAAICSEQLVVKHLRSISWAKNNNYSSGSLCVQCHKSR